MHLVEYLDKKGQRQNLEMVGSAEEIRNQLTREGKVILKVTKQAVGMFSNNKINTNELIAAFIAIGDLLSSGVPISQAIQPAINSLPKTSKLKAILGHVLKTVKEGKTFSQAMSVHQSIFGLTTITMIEAGEAAGKLPQTFVATGEHLRTMDEIKKELYQKLSYPCILFATGIASLLNFSLFAMPMIFKSSLFKMAFEKKDKVSPGMQNAIAWLQKMPQIVPITLGIVIISLIGLFAFYKSNKDECEKIILKISFMKEMLYSQAYYISLNSMANLMSVGARLDQALIIAAKGSTVNAVRKEFEEALICLRKGESFTKGLKSLNETERMMLDTALSSERVRDNLDRTAKRYYSMYIASLHKIAPRIYLVSSIMIILLILFMFLSFGLPYSIILKGIK